MWNKGFAEENFKLIIIWSYSVNFCKKKKKTITVRRKFLKNMILWTLFAI
jgi:hypothetical protein